jgi:DNA-binding Xre family transcriptional regulator
MMRLTVKDTAEARGFKNAKQLADAAGIRYKSMYPIWNGTARMIGLDTLERLCNTLRVQAGLLFEIVLSDEALPEAAPEVKETQGVSKRRSSAKSRRESKQARAAVAIG